MLRALSQHVATIRASEVASTHSVTRSNSRSSHFQCWSAHSTGNWRTWLIHRLRPSGCPTNQTLRLVCSFQSFQQHFVCERGLIIYFQDASFCARIWVRSCRAWPHSHLDSLALGALASPVSKSSITSVQTNTNASDLLTFLYGSGFFFFFGPRSVVISCSRTRGAHSPVMDALAR